MRIIRRGILAVGGLALGGLVVFGALAASGVVSAQTPDGAKAEERRARYEQLLAQNLGVSVETLQNARKAARDQMITEALNAGRITEEQAQKLRSMQPGELRRHAMERVGERMKHVVVNVLQAAAKTIGISGEELRTELRQGKSLAQIANAHGVSSDQLKTGIASDIKAQLQTAVQQGNITQQQANEIESRLSSHLDEMINRTRPHR